MQKILKEKRMRYAMQSAQLRVHADEKGQDTVIQLHPGDWVKIGENLSWICQCSFSGSFNYEHKDKCGFCGSLRPDKPEEIYPIPSRG